MSFSGLSREVRDLIYHELLCPPDGVRLHSRPRREQEATEGRYQKFELLGYDEYESQEEIRNEDGGNMNDLSGSWGFRNNEAAAATPVPTAIFCVNHQIRQEATEVFYRFNRFAFDIDARTALDFLKGLRPSSRRRVHDLGFASFWDSLSTFIARHMSIRSVTIQVPLDIDCEIDRTKEIKPAPYSGWYWWPAAHLMTGLLMAGKIEKLRIGYSATLEIPAPEEEEEAQDITPGQSLHKDPLESLNSISHLRYPGSKDEKDAEGQENVDLWRALREQRSHKFPSFKALLTDQKRRRQRLNFVVKREDDPIGDVGTVLVLTRPTAS